jgi:FixJ family two-component response regulator
MKHGYVAIVDDDAPMREALARLLRVHRIASQSFSSAHAFLDALPSGIPYCLIVDVDMPGMGGIDLQRELLNRGVHIATIVITAYNEAPMPKDALLGAINTAKTRE